MNIEPDQLDINAAPTRSTMEAMRQEELERTLRRIRSIIFNAYVREYLKQNPKQQNGRL